MEGENPAAAGEACYRQGEIHRLRGDFGAAEEAYREASRRGREPQPGLALLRLAQGEVEPPRRRSAESLTETAEPRQARGAACRHTSRSCWRSGDLEAARAARP